MKFQLVLLGCFFALVASKPAEDVGTAQRLLRSCDRNADNALNAAEFAGCLVQASRQQRMAARMKGVSRSELLQSFMDEADTDSNLRADGKELQEWSERFFLADIFGGGDDDDDEDGGDDDGDDDDEYSLTFSEIIGKLSVILQFISSENYAGAVIELYSLVYGYELSSSAQRSIRRAASAIEDGNYGEAIGYVYAVIRELAGGDEAGGVFVVSVSTVTNVASLLQAVIEGNSDNINFFIYRSLAGVIVDFSFLSAESASAVAALIQAVVEDNSSEFYVSLEVIIKDIPGISDEIANALTELLEVVIKGESSQVSVKIFAVLSAIIKEESVRNVVNILVSVIDAVMAGDSAEAIENLTVLYAIFAGESSSSSTTTKTVVAYSSIIALLRDGDSDEAISKIQIIIDDSDSGLSSSQIRTLRAVIQAIEDGDDDEAIAELAAIAIAVASSSSSSSSSSSVEISVEVFVALSSVVYAVEESDDADEIIILIEDILSDSSVTLSVEIRSALIALITILSDDDADTEEALLFISAIMSGSSEAYSRTISEEVYSELEAVFVLIDDEDYDEAIEIIEALLEGESGGSSLSFVVRSSLRRVLIALEEDKISEAYSLLAIISAGDEFSSSLSIYVASAYLAAFEYITRRSYSDAVAVLEALLDDGYIESSDEDDIEELIDDIEGGSYSAAMSFILSEIFTTKFSFSSSINQSFFSVLSQILASNFNGAIATLEDLYDELSAYLRLLIFILIRILNARSVQGALNLVNFIISNSD